MSDTIAETALAIKEMRIRGAGRIARAGAQAMADYSENYSGKTLEGFTEGVESSKRILLESRPTAVSLWNAIHASTKDVRKFQSLDEAKHSVSSNARRFVSMSSKAVEEIAKTGSKGIQNGDVLMTHCNSSAAIGVIKKAHSDGKDIKVYATESRPWRQGILTVRELAAEGIDVTLIIDSAVRSVMKKVDRVFVGADTITSEGTLINKIGTSQLALAADEARVRFMVCSETYKFSPMTLFGDTVTIEERSHDEVVRKGEVPDGVKIFNPVFDSTPPKYIDAIVTEIGMISPGSVYDVMIRQLGEDIFELR